MFNEIQNSKPSPSYPNPSLLDPLLRGMVTHADENEKEHAEPGPSSFEEESPGDHMGGNHETAISDSQMSEDIVNRNTAVVHIGDYDPFRVGKESVDHDKIMSFKTSMKIDALITAQVLKRNDVLVCTAKVTNQNNLMTTARLKVR